MKDANEFRRDVKENRTLAAGMEKYIQEARCLSAEDALEATVRFAKMNGYDFEAEDLSLAEAEARPISDEELDAVAAGGDFCAANFACVMIWNTCNFLNECEAGFDCSQSIWCAQNIA